MTAQSRPDREANTPFSAEDFAKALEGQDYNFDKGQIVRGKVFEYETNGAYVDVGGKSPAFIPLREVSAQLVTNLEEALPLNEEREFLVIRGQDADGQVTLSIRQMEIKRAWDEMAERQDENQSIEVRVTGTNRGGVVVDVGGLRGFIPRSHLLEREDLDSLVGQVLVTTILEVDRDRNKLVLSHRLAERASRMSRLLPGALVDGTVANLKPYGVFVDLGGMTGLLHIKQISKARIPNLDDLFHQGQSVKVIVTEIDEWKNRISLSMKELESYPGELLDRFDEVMSNAEQRVSGLNAEADTEIQSSANPSEEE
ncbi:MAG: S1 RNA-binding domain-containing protein [Cyanobacteria bacterium SID2]|nr:S1 RNA-binding domain-containing protein [Cyanobacteria bacterium SID2]MBP0002745.1 S1 RNA-binding domain-containing protein [Cyanobacteria bacterium SBC]